MNTASAWKQVVRVLVLFLGAGISLLWGISLERNTHGGVMGFPGIYYGTRCLLEHCDPYNPSELQRFYGEHDPLSASDSDARRQSVTLYVNLPPTFLFIAPFAFLPLATAQTLWTLLIVCTFCLATFLMWRFGSAYAPNLSLLLAFTTLANCEIIFSGGNTAGLVVSLCVIAVWCFLRGRFLAIGSICLAVSLAIKPHDAGMIWLYFLIAEGSARRRAIQAGIVAMVVALAGIVWVSFAAPPWITELRTNLATISAPGGINEPGPGSIGVSSPDMIIDLQTAVSAFRNDPRFYNLLTYAVCGLLFATWLLVVRRTAFNPENALYALVSGTAMSMLVTYHRSYDAKLLLVAIPACAMLRTRGGRSAWFGILITSLAILLTGDITLTAIAHLTRNLHPVSALTKVETVFLGRPAPLLLFAVSIFYLWQSLRTWRARRAVNLATEVRDLTSNSILSSPK
jgi:hypothetical protein